MAVPVTQETRQEPLATQAPLPQNASVHFRVSVLLPLQYLRSCVHGKHYSWVFPPGKHSALHHRATELHRRKPGQDGAVCLLRGAAPNVHFPTPAGRLRI